MLPDIGPAVEFLAGAAIVLLCLVLAMLAGIVLVVLGAALWVMLLAIALGLTIGVLLAYALVVWL